MSTKCQAYIDVRSRLTTSTDATANLEQLRRYRLR
jgi:hypothetical protein